MRARWWGWVTDATVLVADLGIVALLLQWIAFDRAAGLARNQMSAGTAALLALHFVVAGAFTVSASLWPERSPIALLSHHWWGGSVNGRGRGVLAGGIFVVIGVLVGLAGAAGFAVHRLGA